MHNAEDQHSAVLVEDLVQNPVVAHAVSQERFFRALDCLNELAARPRVVGKSIDGRLRSPALRRGETPECLSRLPRELNPPGQSVSYSPPGASLTSSQASVRPVWYSERASSRSLMKAGAWARIRS